MEGNALNRPGARFPDHGFEIPASHVDPDVRDEGRAWMHNAGPDGAYRFDLTTIRKEYPHG